MMFRIKTLAAALCVAASPVLAAEGAEMPHAEYREVGAAQDWIGIYSPDQGVGETSAVCAIYARPKNSSVFKDDDVQETIRGEVAAFLSWIGIPAGPGTGELSFMMGLPVVNGANEDHGLSIDGRVSFELVGAGDRLYVRPEDDSAVIAAVRAGQEMVVTARSDRGMIVKDQYSLMGVQATTRLARAGCR